MVSQKMEAIVSKKGFTLVELIVVITILAILGTIGFISIQGYSAQSRDSKRTSDLRSIASALTIKATDGMALTSFVNVTVGQTMVNASVAAGTHVGGIVLAASQADYSAGTPNYTALGVNGTNFKDGTNDYKIGSSTRDGGVFQIAATLENGGSKQALLTGNYSPRTGNMFAASGSATLGSTSYSVSNLTGSGIGYFKRGDIVALNATNTGTITVIGGDGKSFSVTLNANATAPTASWAITVGLGNVVNNGFSEAGGLVASSASTSVAVANGTTSVPY